MADMAEMLANQMRTTLTATLDSAVQAGDIAAARKASEQLSELATLNTKPKAAGPKFGNDDIRKALKAKATWFGIDPRKSAKAIEYGKTMEPDSFESADKFAESLIAAVEEDFKTATAPKPEDEETDPPGGEEEPEDGTPRRKKTDAPPPAEAGRGSARPSSGPWTKLSDAPKDVQAAVKASADKFAANATKEQREKFIATALATHYRQHQAKKGK